jgi:hypothetical protein
MKRRFIALVIALGAVGLVFAGAASGNKPEIDPTWANGVQVNMIGSHLIPGARDTMPNLYAHSEELYLLVFPQQTVPDPATAGPITAGNGYHPQCNPCFHPLLPHPLVYHDHVITGAPGMGTAGTAGVFKGPWKIIVLMYNPAYAYSSNFHPITSATAIDAAEATGNTDVFLKPFGGSNPYELETGNVLICPIVSSHA